MKRLIQLSLIGLLCCGPSPARGAKELTDIAMKRSSEWMAFARGARETWTARWKDAHRRLAMR